MEGSRMGALYGPNDGFEAPHLAAGVVATAAVSLALVVAPAPVAVVVLVALAFACARLGGLDAGLGSVSTAGFMFGWAITEPHFVWEIQSGRDQALLVVLFLASLVAAFAGARLARRHGRRDARAGAAGVRAAYQASSAVPGRNR